MNEIRRFGFLVTDSESSSDSGMDFLIKLFMRFLFQAEVRYYCACHRESSGRLNLTAVVVLVVVLELMLLTSFLLYYTQGCTFFIFTMIFHPHYREEKKPTPSHVDERSFPSQRAALLTFFLRENPSKSRHDAMQSNPLKKLPIPAAWYVDILTTYRHMCSVLPVRARLSKGPSGQNKTKW